MVNTVWDKLTESEKKKLFDFNEEYRQFLSISKTERTFVNNSLLLAKKAGFKDINKIKTLKEGDRIYAINRIYSISF